MGRYAGQKRRATSSKTYELDSNKTKVINFARRYHKDDKEFYIAKVGDYYTSVSKIEFDSSYSSKGNIEHWTFDDVKRIWKTEGECL